MTKSAAMTGQTLSLMGTTEAIKGRSLDALPRRTLALHGMLDALLGPFSLRSEALTAERVWLDERLGAPGVALPGPNDRRGARTSGHGSSGEVVDDNGRPPEESGPEKLRPAHVSICVGA
jgi:hypothetical protein